MCLRYIYLKPKSTQTEFDIRIRNPVWNIKTNANHLYLCKKQGTSDLYVFDSKDWLNISC